MSAALSTAPSPALGPVVTARDITVDFKGPRGMTRVVHGVDLDLRPGETIALLGESGSGKSVTLRALMRLHPKTARIGGAIDVAGEDVLALSASRLAAFRGRTCSMIFQDPGLALDPVYRVGDQIAEGVMRHEGVSRAAGRARALELFERVRIPSPERRLDNYPHEMSGGMRQRAMIALALACRPKVLLADEPTTALDATVQIQVLLLLRELQREFGLAIVFVTHDIGVAVEVADRFAVMYAGRIIESGTSASVVRQASHPYTRGLLASRAETRGAETDRLVAIPGAPPDPAALPPGCSFGPRCPYVTEECRAVVPPPVKVGAAHEARCIRVREILAAA